ncbi:hypothetical protein M0812_24776 [Anaeramoeba flamelloides]|uniref:DNA/RNA-binding protein Alba-like domain-containing protein n=1 Tax=Anaeramoeba flamelloides TaxID=1746091 RepID=A0AAV7YPS2_9EUKA|nr:hypothetical protein M0812_24776 [Anaeramoeba flamelloides]
MSNYSHNNIRVMNTGKLSTYLNFAINCISSKKFKTLTIQATGIAIANAVNLAEGIKRRKPKIHYVCDISSIKNPKEKRNKYRTNNNTKKISKIEIIFTNKNQRKKKKEEKNVQEEEEEEEEEEDHEQEQDNEKSEEEENEESEEQEQDGEEEDGDDDDDQDEESEEEEKRKTKKKFTKKKKTNNFLNKKTRIRYNPNYRSRRSWGRGRRRGRGRGRGFRPQYRTNWEQRSYNNYDSYYPNNYYYDYREW